MGLRIILFVVIALNMTDNVIGAWIYQHASNPALAAQILYLKYAIVAIVFAVFCVDLAYGIKLRRYEWYGLIYLAFVMAIGIAILIVYHDNSGVGRLYLFVFPVVTYFSGSFIGARADFGVSFLVKAYTSAYLGMALLFLLLDVQLGAIPLWRDYLNYSGFILNVKGFTDDVVEGLHGNFFYDFHGVPIARFLGSFGDPLAISYSGMILLVPVFYMFPKHRMLLCAFITAVIAASFTRAVFIFLPLAVLIHRLFGRRGFGASLVISLAGIVAVVVFGTIIAVFSDNSSTNGHVLSVGLVLDFLNVQTLLAGALAGDKLPEFEPGFFNLLFLFGIVPFVLFLLFMRGIYLRNTEPASSTPYIAIVMLAGVLTLSLVSSVFFATTSAWFAWFLAGFASKREILQLLDAAERPAVPQPPSARRSVAA